MNISEILRKALSTLAQGFAFGVGFSLAALGIYYFSYSALMSQAVNSMPDYSSMAAAGVSGSSSRKDYVLTDVEERKEDGRSSIVGKLTNNGSRSASGLQVQVDLFDHGKFVDQYSTYIAGALGPGETRYFKVACGCKDTPPSAHDSYKVQVIGGY